MRKCDEHQTLVHLDVHVCPVFMCGVGDTLIYTDTMYTWKSQKYWNEKILYPQKWSEPTYEPWHVISNNVAFWQVWTRTSLYSHPLSLEIPIMFDQ